MMNKNDQENATGAEEQESFQGEIRWLDPVEIRFLQDEPHQPLEMEIGEEKQSPVRARPAFPKSRPGSWIQIERLHPGGKKVSPIGMIRTLGELKSKDRGLVEKSLLRSSAVPQITRVVEMDEIRDEIRWKMETNLGSCDFRVRQPHRNITALSGGRVLFLDDEENRYEIADVAALDERSRAFLERVI